MGLRDNLVALEVREELLHMMNQMQSNVKSNIEAKSIQLETTKKTISELSPVTWATVVDGLRRTAYAWVTHFRGKKIAEKESTR
jgi:hypothetical protein